MLKLQATSFSNQPLAQSFDAEFDELGGSVGRSDGNTLVLPDDKRYISRTQATIAYRNGSYYLQDHGSASPTIVNGSPVGNGNEVALREGDELRIGEYVLVAHVGGGPPGALADPFADLLPPMTPAANVAAAQPAGARIGDPFADPLGAPAPPRPAAPASGPGLIPQDFDPFSDLISQSSAPAMPQSPQSLPMNMPSASGDSVDALFGLGAANAWDPLSPTGSQGASNMLPPDAGADPFADLMPQPAKPKATTQRDDAPMLSGAFNVPRPKPEVTDPPPRAVAPPRAPEQPRQSQPAPQPAPGPAGRAPPPARDMVVSWDNAQEDPGQEIKTVVLPSPRRSEPKPQEQRAAPAQAGVPPRAQAPAPKPTAQAAYSPPPAVSPAPSAAPASSAGEARPDELLAAFLEGAGATNLKIPGGLTPELMNLLGKLMHESVRGTLDLLLARALTKREVRAQATVIVARENNPLKFSPTVDAAFTNLLAPQGQGFMAPTQAMRDAYNDLRSHQFGFMAGMRAALEGVLGRFDPAQLEGRLTKKSMLGSLVPSSRRAQLWELYEQLYREISKEAQDDFQTLFGKEFLRAYEAQIDKLEQEDAANKR